MNLKLILSTLLLCSLFSVMDAQEIQTEIKPTPQNLAEIFVEENTFEFGKINQDEVIQNVFELTNVGEEPLVISDAKGSCGCTVPNWPKDPILPGETAQILVKFNSKGKRGKQSKRVTITANTEPAQTFLTIKGEILVPEVITDVKVKTAADNKASISNERVDVNSFVVFPNPTAEVLNVELKSFVGKPAVIQIFNQAGKQMDIMKIQKIQNETYNFEVTNYPSGIYVVSTKVEGKMRVAKQVSIVR